MPFSGLAQSRFAIDELHYYPFVAIWILRLVSASVYAPGQSSLCHCLPTAMSLPQSSRDLLLSSLSGEDALGDWNDVVVAAPFGHLALAVRAPFGQVPLAGATANATVAAGFGHVPVVLPLADDQEEQDDDTGTPDWLFLDDCRMNGSDSDHHLESAAASSAGPSDLFRPRRSRATRTCARSRSPPRLLTQHVVTDSREGGGGRPRQGFVLGAASPTLAGILSHHGSLGAACHAALLFSSPVAGHRPLCILECTGVGSAEFTSICQEALRVVQGYAHAGRQVYVGITENPRRRFDEHLAANSAWETCRVLVQAPTSRETAAIERFLISRIRDRFFLCSNYGPGGERASQGMPHFVYVVVGGSLLRR